MTFDNRGGCIVVIKYTVIDLCRQPEALREIVLYNSLLSLIFSGNNPGIFQNTLKLVLQFAPGR